MFACSKCGICAVVPSMTHLDEAYLEFLNMYDNGKVVKTQDLESIIHQEKLLRPKSEIASLINHNNANENELLKNILYSKKDYIVDFRVIQEPEPELGGELKDLPIEETIIDALYKKDIKRLYKFQEKAIKEILLGKDVLVIAPTASGKTEAFSIPIVQKNF